MKTAEGCPKTRVVVLGSGWGGMSFLRQLDPTLTKGRPLLKRWPLWCIASTSCTACTLQRLGPAVERLVLTECCPCLTLLLGRPRLEITWARLARPLPATHGLPCLQELMLCVHPVPAADGQYDVTLVSPRNYFLYTPLLPSSATGAVEPRSIVDPVRRHISDRVSACLGCCWNCTRWPGHCGPVAGQATCLQQAQFLAGPQAASSRHSAMHWAPCRV